MDVKFPRFPTASVSALALSVGASALVLSLAVPATGWATPAADTSSDKKATSTDSDTKSDEELAKEQADEEKSSIDGSGSSSNRTNVRSFIDIFGQRTAVFTGGPGVGTPGDDQTSAVSGGSVSGLAGGDGMAWHQGRLALWGEASGAIFDDANPSDDVDGYSVTAVFGSDYRFTDRLLGGMALSYEHVGIDFNSGRERDVSYFGPTIYGAYLITDTVSVSALGSYAYGWNTEEETGGANHDHGSHRFLTSGSVAYNNVYENNFTAYGAMGILYTAESFESYTNSGGASVNPDTTQIGQLNWTGNVGYLIDAGKDAIVEPYAAVRMEYDFVNTGTNDRFGTLLGGGVRVTVSNALTLDAFANTEVARSNESSTDFGLNVRFQF